MRIAVVTPYLDEPLGKLRRCHDSVAGQTHPDVTHVMVADGRARPEVGSWERCVHVELPVTTGDSGATPRLVGSGIVAAMRFDAVAFLDADNWFAPDHLERLAGVQARGGALVVTCARMLVRPDTGGHIGVCRESDGATFNDTNCYLFTERAFPLLAAWGLRTRSVTSVISRGGDRIVWRAVLDSAVPRAHSPEPTVFYETTWAGHYEAFGLPVPEWSKVLVVLAHDRTPRVVSHPEFVRLRQAGEALPVAWS